MYKEGRNKDIQRNFVRSTKAKSRKNVRGSPRLKHVNRDYEEQPKFNSMSKQHHKGWKETLIYVRVLDNFLKSNVGRSYDEVYSKLRRAASTRSHKSVHFLRFVSSTCGRYHRGQNLVNLSPLIIDDEYYTTDFNHKYNSKFLDQMISTGFFIDKDGILRYRDYKTFILNQRKKYKMPISRIKLETNLYNLCTISSINITDKFKSYGMLDDEISYLLNKMKGSSTPSLFHYTFNNPYYGQYTVEHHYYYFDLEKMLPYIGRAQISARWYIENLINKLKTWWRAEENRIEYPKRYYRTYYIKKPISAKEKHAINIYLVSRGANENSNY